jgi:tellurite resistance protein TerC
MFGTFIEVLVFIVVVGFMLWLDLREHRSGKPITLKDAAIWSAVWVGVSLAFAGYIALVDSPDKAGLFTAGYLLEKSLSVDNLFVFMAIFASFGVKDSTQHRILYYGILGAIVFRLLFISLGSAFLLAGSMNPVMHMVVYTLFGAIVLYSAYKMTADADDDDTNDEDYTKHWSIRLFRDTLRLPVTAQLEGDKFFVRREVEYGKRTMWLATPLFLCLLVTETSDIAFAFDSVPAVVAVTKDPFLVYASNIFAILGLRSMYFLLVAAKKYLCHLEKAVVGILVFIGLKMLLEAFHAPIAGMLGFAIEIPVVVSLGVVVLGLAAGVVASYMFPENEAQA